MVEYIICPLLSHPLVGIVDEVLGTLNLLQMDIGALEGQTRGDYFLDSIFDPSVNQCNAPIYAPREPIGPKVFN